MPSTLIKSGTGSFRVSGKHKMRRGTVAFLRIWRLGYTHPRRAIELLSEQPAPLWGLCAQGVRGLLDGLLLYLPLALMGKEPSTPSYLVLLPTATYYQALVFLAPVLLLMQWLLISAIAHLTLRLLGRRGGFDQILNLTGLSALVVGAFLVLWDWVWVLVGLQSDVLLGYSHLVLDLWGMVITTIGLRCFLDVPVWLGVVLNLVMLVAGLPLAVIFMRAPV